MLPRRRGCKEGKTHNAEGKTLLQAGGDSIGILFMHPGKKIVVIPGRLALVSDAPW